MSIKQCCSLCCTACSDYKRLQNEMGGSNEIYEITVKYFDPMLLTEDKTNSSKDIRVLCQDCWIHIKEFHEFQQTVLKTRMIWDEKINIKQLSFEVKQEGELQYNVTTFENGINFDKSEEEGEQFEDVHLGNLENCNLKTETLSSSDDNGESTTKQFDKGCENVKPISEDKKHNCEVKDNRKSRRGRKRKDLSDIVTEGSDSDKDARLKYVKKKAKVSENPKIKGRSAFNLEKARESDAFIAKWKPELICDICSEITTNFDKLRSHFKEKHKSRFYIKCCERKFYRRCVLVNHIQLHLNPETHKCDICGKSSSTKHNLKLHKKIMHEETKQLKCEICEKLFKQKVTLERHLLTHATGSKDFICPECGKGYVAEQLLKLHIKHVHNVDRVCDQCGKTIHGLQALKKHLMEHAGIERPKYRCDVCGLELKSPNGLKRHKAAYHNDGTTIYICSVCGKIATSQNALWNHKKHVHIEERKFKCTYCDKAFKRPKSLREHIATHTGQDLYQCPHCPQTFKVSANMHHHRKKVHPIEWEEGRKNRLQYPKVNINQVKKQVVI